jgi:DNA repair protein RecO (recombination protein O)
LGGLYAGYYVAELLDGLTDEDDPHPELFDLADQTLAALAAGDTNNSRGLTAPGETVAKLIMRFELGALRLLGHLPSLQQCVECGGAVKPAGRVAFGQLDGGVLCANCRAGKKQVVMVSAGVLRTMAQLADTDGAAWRRTKIDPRSLGELRGLLNHYFTQLLGRKPKMHEYLGVLGN